MGAEWWNPRGAAGLLFIALMVVDRCALGYMLHSLPEPDRSQSAAQSGTSGVA